MSQSVKGSLVETITNIVVGFAFNWTCNMLILPHYDCRHITGLMALELGIWFTMVSFVRLFLLRRLFNGMRVFMQGARQ